MRATLPPESSASAKDPDNPNRRLFLPAKNNVGKDQSGLAFSVEPFTLPSGIETSRVLWEPDPVLITADEAMASAPEEGERTMTEDAIALLRDALSFGRVLSKDIKRQATEAGISDKALRTARERLAIIPSREGFGADMKTFWALGAVPVVPSDTLQAPLHNGAQLGKQGTTGNGEVVVEEF